MEVDRKKLNARKAALSSEVEVLRRQLVQAQQQVQLLPQAMAARQGAIEELNLILRNKEGGKRANTDAAPKTPKSKRRLPRRGQ